MEELEHRVLKHFGIKNMKHYQKEVFLHIKKGRDCFVSQPTGSGKSLTFQTWPLLHGDPDTMREAILILKLLVVCPITSLMEDQISFWVERD